LVSENPIHQYDLINLCNRCNLWLKIRDLPDLCVIQLANEMKKFLMLIGTVSLALGACERHPASQLPKEGEGAGKEEASESPKKQTTPETSPSGTPKTYFPQNN
jgi:hypothetical protein